MIHKFYIKSPSDNTISGPHSARKILEMTLPPDTLVSEENIENGQWLELTNVDLTTLSEHEPVTEEPVTNEPPIIEQKAMDEMQENDEEPLCLKKWNWGAFVLPGLWGLFNRVYWPLFVMMILVILTNVFLSTDPLEEYSKEHIKIISNLIISFILGVKGNGLSWNEYKNSKTPCEFDQRQKIWNIIGIIAIPIIVIIYFLSHD